MDSIFALIMGYVFGSIPFGLLLTKAAGLGDVRDIGSGNIGATNVLRTGNKGLAAATLLLDFAKGFVPVYFAWTLFPGTLDRPLWYPMPVEFAALGAVLGHCFPVWLKFKGGKGVATNAGVTFGLAWPLGVVYAAVWIAVLAIFRISSLAGMSAVAVVAIAAILMGFWSIAGVLAVIALLIIWLHRANIGRLVKGEEPKIGSSKT
jgi:glycerol-3-phosphate acyltransferase PlsY